MKKRNFKKVTDTPCPSASQVQALITPTPAECKLWPGRGCQYMETSTINGLTWRCSYLVLDGADIHGPSPATTSWDQSGSSAGICYYSAVAPFGPSQMSTLCFLQS